MNGPTTSLQPFYLGRRSYESVHRLQVLLQHLRIHGEVHDLVLFVEHEPVITLGRRGDASHVLLSPQQLQQLGVSVVRTDRGGDVTYHGPGQLVGYPIVTLHPPEQDVGRYVDALVDTMAGLARERGVYGGKLGQYPGLWVDQDSPGLWPGEQQAKRPAKIGAVGVRISHWTTMHGFAFNSHTDLDGFSMIVPCGIESLGVTSLQALGAQAPPPSELAPEAARLLALHLGRQANPLIALTSVADDQLEKQITSAARVPPRTRAVP